MRRKTTYDDFQVHRTPERLKHWRHEIEYSKRDRLCRGAADLVVYKLPAPIPAAAGKKIAFISDFHYNGSAEQLNIVQCLKKYLQTCQPDLLLFGGDVCSDSESLPLIPELSIAAEVYTVKPDNPRALDAEKLAEEYRKNGVRATPFGSVSAAVNEVLRVGDGIPTLIMGSLYMYCRVMDALEDRNVPCC